MDYYDQQPLRHVGDIPSMGAERYGDKLAFEYRGEELTYEELEAQSNQLANALEGLGVETDDRVGVYLENNLQYPISLFGIVKTGAVPVPLNHRMDMGRLTYIVDDASIDTLVGSIAFSDVVRDLADQGDVSNVVLPAVAEGEEYDWFDLLGDESEEYETEAVDYEETVALQPYTSGTTGNPKGVLTTHQNILSTINSYSRLGAIDPETDRALVVLPLFHMYGLGAILLPNVYAGGTVVLKTLPEAENLLEAITEHEITSFGAVPAIFIEMVNELERNPEQYDVSSIESLGSGAAPLADDTRRRIEDAFDTPLTEGWGMTETTPAGCTRSSRGVQKPAGCIGQPVPDLEMKLVDPETRETRVPPEHLDPTAPAELTGHEVDFDDEPTYMGEIAVRGPQICKGYYGLPEKTDAVFDDEGWFYTDDIARVDEDRFLWMVDRADDMIIVGGENVYPAEVEDALFEHPAIEEAAVVAAPHEVKGEAPVAYVVLGEDYEAGVDVAEADVRRFALDHVASYAHPRRVVFVEQLPRSGTQKVQRFKLEEQAEQDVGTLTSSDRL